MRPILTLALILIALPALAHGPEKNDGKAYDGHAAALGEPGDPKAKARTIIVTMNDNMRFSPASITAAKGETIRFQVKNTGSLRHEFQLGTLEELLAHAKVMEQHPDMEHDDPNAVTVEPGQTRTLVWKFTKAGRFDFACLIPGHYQGGMKGNITVR